MVEQSRSRTEQKEPFQGVLIRVNTSNTGNKKVRFGQVEEGGKIERSDRVGSIDFRLAGGDLTHGVFRSARGMRREGVEAGDDDISMQS